MTELATENVSLKIKAPDVAADSFITIPGQVIVSCDNPASLQTDLVLTRGLESSRVWIYTEPHLSLSFFAVQLHPKING